MLDSTPCSMLRISDDESLSDVATDSLPATTSLPSLTVKTPKEKLTTVLKESERLLRNTRPELAQTSVTRRLDTFIQSLKEETKEKQVVKELESPWVSQLPEHVLARRPRLSADNEPGDRLEIVIGDAQKHLLQAKSTRILRQSIAPKVKRASIIKLNEELEVKIKEQHALVVDERQAEKRLLQQKSAERANQERQESDDEFGISEKEDEVEAEINEKVYQEERVNLVTRLIHSDDEEIIAQPDFRMATAPPRRKVALSSDDDEEEEEELLNHLIDGGSPEKDNSFQGLTQILSGQFANEPADEPATEEEQHTELGSDQESETMNKGTTGLIDFEAEDEDSEVSADEIDEDAIARELQECAFLDDGAASDEMDDSEQFILHRQLKAEEEAAEMEMFMNRFVPDDVLRETGAYAELRKKYADNDEDGTGLQGMAGSKSKYGQIRVHTADQAQSHPDFLKLLDQDRLSTGSEPETEMDSETELEEYDDESCEKIIPDLGHMDSLLTSSMTINTLTPTSKAKRMYISVDDEELRARLLVKEKDDNQPALDTKRNRTTFETVSSRPVIAKEKMGKK
ncbi:hypothetical protein PSACC_02691 [Paramicrosporidium saccamoebae]|uniref:Uncharacterized protein n=1 Tax=Paramicrosporidium saccamoebae TaxID=1246581 RepID=A0A2H9TIB2_9FUNG|nr:hypothetical protein PSACC_02691 [Paramicrosporidium saccamoebae]